MCEEVTPVDRVYLKTCRSDHRSPKRRVEKRPYPGLNLWEGIDSSAIGVRENVKSYLRSWLYGREAYLSRKEGQRSNVAALHSCILVDGGRAI